MTEDKEITLIADATNEISESIPFPLISDVMIANATTEEIDNLLRRLNRELCLRRPVDNITKLNLWNQKDRKRKIKYWFGRDVSGWVGTISVRNEIGLQFIVTRSIVTENEQPSSFKKQLKRLLADDMVVRLNI